MLTFLVGMKNIGFLMLWLFGGDKVSVIVRGMVVGLRETEKGSKILLVADEKAVHNILVEKDFIWKEEMRGKNVEINGSSTEGIFIFADRKNGK